MYLPFSHDIRDYEDYGEINYKMKLQVCWKMEVCEARSLTRGNRLNWAQSHNRQEKKNWAPLADTVGDSFIIPQPLAVLPASTLDAGKAGITSLPVFLIASQNQAAQVQIWLCFFLATWAQASHLTLFPSVYSSEKCPVPWSYSED